MGRYKIDPNRKFIVTDIDREFKAITDAQEAARKAKQYNEPQIEIVERQVDKQKIIEFPKVVNE